MPQPLLCLDADVRHVAERFRSVVSKPHDEYVVTVLLGLLEGEGKRTLRGIMSTVAQPPSVRGLPKHGLPSGWNRCAPRCSRWWKPNENSSARHTPSVEVVPTIPLGPGL